MGVDPLCQRWQQATIIVHKQMPYILSAVAGALTAPERKVVAVATKLVTCPALLLLDRPLSPFNQPQHAASAAHLVQSLRTAACQLHMNIIIAEQGLQDATFGAVDNVIMLDEQALPVYAGTSTKASSCAEHACMQFPAHLIWQVISAVLLRLPQSLLACLGHSGDALSYLWRKR